MRSAVPIVTALLLAACAGAPARNPASSNPASTTDTADFTITSEPGTWRNHPVVQGYVQNKRGMRASRVILRVESLDATGKVVASEPRHLDRDIPANDRVFYQVPVPGEAAAYRVRVDYVFWKEGAGGML